MKNEDGSPKTEKSLEHIEILKKSLAVIDELNPDIFFIENPRERILKHIDFFKRNVPRT